MDGGYTEGQCVDQTSCMTSLTTILLLMVWILLIFQAFHKTQKLLNQSLKRMILLIQLKQLDPLIQSQLLTLRVKPKLDQAML